MMRLAAAVLCELELIVKRNLINLGKVSFADIDDFDILLSDYFDLIAGGLTPEHISGIMRCITRCITWPAQHSWPLLPLCQVPNCKAQHLGRNC